MTTYTGVSTSTVPGVATSSTVATVSLEVQSLGTGGDAALGAYFRSTGSHAIYSTVSGSYGAALLAYNTGENGYSVVAYANGGGYSAVYGDNPSDLGYGVYGTANGIYGSGIRGEVTSASGAGVEGHGGNFAGVYGVCYDGYGVYGRGYRGVLGNCMGDSNAGVMGRDVGYSSCKAVWGEATGTSSYGVYCTGPANVTGYLTKSGGGFRIDHPLDPANKYLNHSFVESPDMKNIYDGVGTADASGSIDVTMPDYFHDLNVDFRYQLTAIGGPAPDLHIKEELKNKRFSIGGAKPGQKVSWQVTGTRNDPWAAKNRMIVEEDKPAHEKGKYRHYDVYNQPIERWIDYNPDTRHEIATERDKQKPASPPKADPPPLRAP